MKRPNVLSCIFSLVILYVHNATYALDTIPEDISTWTERGTVLSTGVAGTWDEKASRAAPIGVYKKDGIYYLHYLSGFEGCWDADDDVNHQSVGLATSTDGINFTKYAGNPVLKPHDFVPVNSHEEGIRTASIRYMPQLGKWLAYLGVESPGGTDTCPFMGSTADCACNIPVDASIFAATSVDGKNWTIEGLVNGVYNSQENYIDDFQYQGGQYYVWSHRAQGGQTHNISKGPDFMNLTPMGEIPELCWGWSELHTYLHDDGNTVTAIYDPNGGCAAANKNLYFGDTSLDNLNTVSNERVVVVQSDERKANFIYKDVESGLWRWYYNPATGAEAGTIQLRTHPIETLGAPLPPPPNTRPNSPSSVIAE